MMNLVNATFLDLILTGTGVQPQIPDPANLKYNDPGFDPEIHLMIGQRAYNVDDNIVYMRTKTGIEKTGFLSDAERARIMTVAERAKLVGIDEGANNYTHPETHSLAIITETDDKKIMTALERTKLAGLPSSIPPAPVTSVNGQTGDVEITLTQPPFVDIGSNYFTSGGPLKAKLMAEHSKVIVYVLDPTYGDYLFEIRFDLNSEDFDWEKQEFEILVRYTIPPLESEALKKIMLTPGAYSMGENVTHDDYTLTLPSVVGHLGTFKLRLRHVNAENTYTNETNCILIQSSSSGEKYIEIYDFKQGYFTPPPPAP